MQDTLDEHSILLNILDMMLATEFHLLPLTFLRLLGHSL